MKQEELESKVREIFEQQGFKVTQNENRITADTDEKELVAETFSSENYCIEDIDPSNDSLVFVDEDLAEISDKVGNRVSVIREELEEVEYDLPSYEIIGDIAVINQLTVSEEEAVEGILAHHGHVNTILLKEDNLGGEFRVGEYRKLYGDDTETVHTEFGLKYRVDPTKVYFSERFGTERDRVTSQIQEGEHVLVMFAGVGPFALLAAKRGADRVVAVEKNPVAAEYLEENVELNGMTDTVRAVQGDVKDVVPELGDFDRVIMPLPGHADIYLELAAEHVKDGGVVHYYRFVRDDDWTPVLNEVEAVAEKLDMEFEVMEKTVCGNRSPAEDRVCLDVRFEQ
jgi:tRNA (guanine37-N1)-methyltransferase